VLYFAMKTKSARSLFATVATLLVGVSLARAASGTWTNNNSAAWSGTSNWLTGVVADGASSTADFSTTDITVDRTVTLDSARNIGNVIFGDASGAQNWTLANSGGSALTLTNATSSPTITVTNIASATLPLAGAGGFTKAGPGTLVLSGANTYSGATVVTNGTLQLTNGAAAGPLLYLSFDSTNGTTVVNGGTGGAAMNGVLTGTATITNGGGRYGNGLAIGAGASTAGYVLVSSAVQNFNVATNNWTLALWLKTSTVGAAYFYQGAGAWASGNTTFYLNTAAATGNSAAGTHAGGVRFAQGWEGSTAVINDGNWHFVVMTCATGTKTMYVDGAVDAWTINSWGGNGNGTQIRIGGTGTGEGDGQVGLNGLIDEVYIYNRTLSASEVGNLMNTTSLVATPPLPLVSPISVAANAKLDLNGNSTTIAGLSGNGTLDTTLAGTPTLSINNSADYTFNGSLTNSVGTLSLFKSGAGNETLGGNNPFTGNTTISGGTLTVTGTNSGPGNVTISSGTLKVSGNGGITPSAATSIITVGSVAGQAAAVYQSGAGTVVSNSNVGGGGWQIGGAVGALGYYNLSGGTVNVAGEIDPGGSAGGAGTFGQIDISGGTLNIPNRAGGTYFLPNRGAAGEASVVNVLGGTVQVFGGGTPGDGNFNGLAINWASTGAAQSCAVTIGNGGQFLTPSLRVKPNEGANFNGLTGNAANFCALNLNSGGLLQTLGFLNGPANNPLVSINFNGGTLKAGIAASTNFVSGLGGIYCYQGGGTFDDNGQVITLGQPLLTPAGNGVASIGLSVAGSGYIVPPQVVITDATGTGASAYATINPTNGAVTGVVVTCAGNNYSTPTASFVGSATVAATIGSVTTAANVLTGGFTKTGSGTLTLATGNTYAGATKVFGGTLNLTPATLAPAAPGDLVVSNAIAALDVTGGSGLSVANLTLAHKAVINIAYGALGANPAFAAISAGGALTTPGTNLVLNLTGTGFVIGTVPLISYTGTALTTITNISLGTLPAGVIGNLVNNTAAKRIDLNISFIGQSLVWFGSVSTNWDINTSFNWNSGAAKYLQYGTTNIFGDLVQFDDSLDQTALSTNINITTAVRPSLVTVDSSANYNFNGAGSINGATALIKNGGSTLSLNQSNSYTGGTIVNAGSVAVSNSAALGTGAVTLAGGALQANRNLTNSNPIALTVDSSVSALTNVNGVFNGNVTGLGGLTKIGDGTFTLGGSNTYSGATLVNGGKLALTGTNVGTGRVIVGNLAANGVMDINGGSLFANYDTGQFNSSFIVGNLIGGAGSVRLNSGTLAVKQQFALGSGTAGVSGFTMNGGTATFGSFMVVGFRYDHSVFNMNGGSLFLSNNLITVAAGGAEAIGAVNLRGGTITSTATTGYGPTIGGMFVGENGTGTLNVFGNGAVTLTGWNLRIGQLATATGTVNLNGGLVTAGSVSRGAGLGTLNFNGGTLRASANNDLFLPNLTYAYVYNGGAAVDDGGFNITIPQALLGVTDYGVASIAVTNGGSGYIEAPFVSISGGSGSNATAIAQINYASGAVTNVVVTCPGSGYASGDVLSVAFSDGGGSGAVSDTPLLVTNAPGGLVKQGAGRLNLTGVNTYAGTTTVQNGVLGGTGSVNGNVLVQAGGTLAPGLAAASGTFTLNGGSLTLQGAASFRISKNTGVIGGDKITGSATANYGGTLTVTNIGTDALTNGDTFTLFTSTAYAGAFTTLNLPALTGGLVWSNRLAIDGSLTVVSAPSIPSLVGVSLTGTNLNLLGTNGSPNAQFVVITSTNITTPATNWTRLLTNNFNGSGSFNLNFSVATNRPQQYFRLLLP
jgi:autotransporter-associated beta strand protein